MFKDGELSALDYTDNGTLKGDACKENLGETTSSDEGGVNSKDFKTDLRSLVLKFNCTHALVDGFLGVVSKHIPKVNLPKTARTLLKTPSAKVAITTRSNMEYVHLGISAKLEKIVEEVGSLEKLCIGLNIDGVPLFKSSPISAWLILGRVINVPLSRVFPISVAIGPNKPNGRDLSFLDDTVDELKHLIETGLSRGTKLVQVELSFIVCDCPAKSLVKGTKLYSGYNACFDCSLRGTYKHGAMRYLENDHLEHRTDASFRSQGDANHHQIGVISPFCRLPIDMIQSFPVDYMHACLLGVTKKLLKTWFVDSKCAHRVTAAQMKEANERLVILKSQTPKDFARKPRSLTELSMWKATEFRTFLVYTGKIVLLELLDSEKYNHFMCFSVAITILLSTSLAKYHAEYAHILLERFVHACKDIYGDRFMVYNIHSLLHIAKQIKQYGNLQNCSAFPFEDYMQVVKNCTRSGNKPLAQIIKRLQEKEHLPLITSKASNATDIALTTPNNYYLTVDNRLVQLLRTRYTPGVQNTGKNDKTFVCRQYLKPKPYFDNPCTSKLVHIYKIDPDVTCVTHVSQNDLHSKCFYMHSSRGPLLQALCHSVE